MKVIFLDIDGPLIPGRNYYRPGATMDRVQGIYRYDPSCVEMVNYAATITGATIVHNTMHNPNGADHLRRQAGLNGLHHERLFHPTDLCTQFPLRFDTRLGGISNWLARHLEVTEWVVLDDEQIPTKRLVHVDYTMGTDPVCVAKIIAMLGNVMSEEEAWAICCA